ncbi:MAG: hypothetical protein ACRDA5_10775 [Clostridium sp.]
MPAYINNQDGLFIKTINYQSKTMLISIFFSNTGDEPAYDVSLSDSPIKLPPQNGIFYSLGPSYIKYPTPAIRNYFNPGGGCGNLLNIPKVDPGEIVEVTISYWLPDNPPEPGISDIATVKYTTNSEIKYGKSNIATLE